MSQKNKNFYILFSCHDQSTHKIRQWKLHTNVYKSFECVSNIFLNLLTCLHVNFGSRNKYWARLERCFKINFKHDHNFDK